MARFAKIQWETPARKKGTVVETIVAEQDFINSGVVGDSIHWVQFSKHTYGGVHYDPNTGQPDGGFALRYNGAGIGDTYDAEKDAFYAQCKYPSWTLNPNTFIWESPIPQPTAPPLTHWDEETQSWIEFNYD